MSKYYVMTNRYSHEGSGFADIVSGHDTLKAAKKAADSLWATGKRRFVRVDANDPNDGTVYDPENPNPKPSKPSKKGQRRS